MKYSFLPMLVTSSLIVGCTVAQPIKGDIPETRIFHDYLRNIAYEPIVPPSTVLEPGSVIAYVEGLEQVQAARSSCAFKEIPKEYKDTAILNKTYNSDIGAGIDASLVGLLSGKLDISAAAQTDFIKRVEYSFSKPFVWSVDRLSIERYIKASPEDCVAEASKKGNVIVYDVIGAEGYELSFYDSDGAKVSAHAEIQPLLKADPNVRYSVSKTGTVHVDSELYFGYRLLEGFIGAGSNPTDQRNSFYALEVVSPKKAEELRTLSKQ